MTDWVWTYGGICFGYRERINLWTYDARHVGRFHGARIHAADGCYLGELWRGRLIIDQANRSDRQAGFAPEPQRQPQGRYTGFVGPQLPRGLEDFSPPERVR